MEVTRAGEALLRHATLLPFLAPAIARTPRTLRAATAISRHQCNAQPTSIQGSRAFSMSSRRQEEQLKDKSQEPQASSGAKKENSGDSIIASLLDSHLDPSSSSPGAPRSRPSFRPATRATDGGLSSHMPSKGSSMDDLFSAMGPPQRSPSRFSKNEMSEISRIMDLGGPAFGGPKTTGPPAPWVDKPFDLKLNATIGRTVRVDSRKGMDVARAFRELDMQCKRNRVRADFMAQRFHERPGLKRKRLVRERWRRRFKDGFKSIVSRVHHMKRQGW